MRKSPEDAESGPKEIDLRCEEVVYTVHCDSGFINQASIWGLMYFSETALRGWQHGIYSVLSGNAWVEHGRTDVLRVP